MLEVFCKKIFLKNVNLTCTSITKKKETITSIYTVCCCIETGSEFRNSIPPKNHSPRLEQFLRHCDVMQPLCGTIPLKANRAGDTTLADFSRGDNRQPAPEGEEVEQEDAHRPFQRPIATTQLAAVLFHGMVVIRRRTD